jgi:GT2 family glycosyltransferase/glycosyltransferase involved in cell wall biosynthesis
MDVDEQMVTFGLQGDGVPFASADLPPSGPSGWAPGTAVLVRRSLLTEFPLKESMGAYFEDNEWSYRISRTRSGCFWRSSEALVVHHVQPKHAPASDFASRSQIVELLASYARFYELHGLLLGPWLFDHLPDLRADDGSLDLAAAKLLMELVSAKGTDWTLMAWMNGDLDVLLTSNQRLVELQADRTRERAAFDARAARDANTIATLDARLRRVDESVTWQLFQRVRARAFAVLGGEESRAVYLLQGALRRLGRVLLRRGARSPIGRAPSRLVRAPRGLPGPIDFPEASAPHVSIVIPLYSRADLTEAALRSILNQTEQGAYELILVDDSEDAPMKALLERVGGARVIVNDSNLGYLRSVKRGAGAARGRWLVLCNNDIEVQPGWLAALVDCGESDRDIAVVAPKYIYPDGSLAEAGGIIWRDGTGANYGRGDDPDGCHYCYRREIDYGSAAALMVRADFWREVGGFDERFEPMYYEDTDLCFEARRRGLRVVYEPRAEVLHLEGATAGVDESSGHKRHQGLNRPKFVSKWREALDTEHLANESGNLWQAANRQRATRVLVVDHRMPTWDRDSGGLRMFGIVEALNELGCHVSLCPDNGMPMQPYTRELQRLGTEVLFGADRQALLRRIGPGLSVVILSRAEVASRWLEPVREYAPAATVVFDTVDLHWLREARRVGIGVGSAGNGAPLPRKVAEMRDLELGLVRTTDATLVVTEDERAQVLRDALRARVHVVPNVHELREVVAPPEGREGVVFVGGFEHPPNVDAAVVLVREVMPLVWRELGDVRATIVGDAAPAKVKELASELVDVRGWVPDLDPVLESARVLLAPLTYGAGLKGKVTQALAFGLPVVTTPVGAEGLDAHDGEHMLIGDTPEALAEQVVRVLGDDELWRRLSRSGQQLVADRCSPQVMRERLENLLDELLLGRHPVKPVPMKDSLSLR